MRDGCFTLEFLQNLPSDTLEGLYQLCEEFDRLMAKGPREDEVVEAYAVLQAFCNSRRTTISFSPLGKNPSQNVATIAATFNHLKVDAASQLTERRSLGILKVKTLEYEDIFAKVAYYEFSEADFNRVQVLINEMRDIIRESVLIAGDHKRRLLRKLEAMQAELHLKTRDINRFWAFIGEAGITIRKFGEDLKPITERVQELGKIVIGVILAKEGIKALPEISKLLIPQ